MASQHTIINLLDAIEAEMQRNGMWQLTAPPAESLASIEPFAVDTLLFEEWLQWIFVPKLRAMIAAGAALPTACSIAPMAEESWIRVTPEPKALIALLAHIDLTLTTPNIRHLQ